MKIKQLIPKFLREGIRMRRLRNRFPHCMIDSINVSFDAILEARVKIVWLRLVSRLEGIVMLVPVRISFLRR